MNDSKFSFFKKSTAELPEGSINLETFVTNVCTGTWQKEVQKVRDRAGTKQYKLFKNNLAAVTVSGEFKSRDNKIPTNKRLKKHSGYICIDVDKKDNPKMRTKDLIDPEAVAEFISAGGEGKKIIYRCKVVTTVEEHRRIYDAVIKRLEKKHFTLKPDPIVKSVASLQFVTYDPEARYNPKTKLVIQPLPPIKHKKEKVTEDKEEQLKQLYEYIDALGKIDITKTYENWLLIMFGLSFSFGESARAAVHLLCHNYKGYVKHECDEKYDSCLENDYTHVEKPVSVATVFQLINDHLPKVKVKQLNRKYQPTHAVGMGVGEEILQGDLAGLVQYRLFLFKKQIDKESKEVIELQPVELNRNAFEIFLSERGFYRYKSDKFIHIRNNVVDMVDINDVLRIITDYFKTESGNYNFKYDDNQFEFRWEEILHKWNKIKETSSIKNQIFASLAHWVPNLLRDTVDTSYIPYRNGVLEITGKKTRLIPYAEMTQQIWKEQILPREFKWNKHEGMFENFFMKVMGRGDTDKSRAKSEHYQRAMWYYGYMLQGTKRMSTARAWILYDVRTGNNGRSGKTIIGNALSHLRSLAPIDGKRTDLNDRFAFQSVTPWTKIVLIDDVQKGGSLTPLFNMITGRTTADRKNIDPIVKDDIKYMLTSNWFLEMGGTSEIGRQFVSQLDDFFIKYSVSHHNTITPIVDYYGKEFFTDWDELDWQQFDTFSVRCLQCHLYANPPENTIIGNARMLRFIQVYEEELFFDLCMNLIQYVKRTADGNGLMVPQQLMNMVVVEHYKETRVKAGKILKDFFDCLGTPSIDITSMATGGTSKMAYRLNCKWKQLDFGNYSNRLPKPKET